MYCRTHLSQDIVSLYSVCRVAMTISSPFAVLARLAQWLQVIATTPHAVVHHRLFAVRCWQTKKWRELPESLKQTIGYMYYAYRTGTFTCTHSIHSVELLSRMLLYIRRKQYHLLYTTIQGQAFVLHVHDLYCGIPLLITQAQRLSLVLTETSPNNIYA